MQANPRPVRRVAGGIPIKYVTTTKMLPVKNKNEFIKTEYITNNGKSGALHCGVQFKFGLNVV